MITENLSTLKIHKLTKEQYEHDADKIIAFMDRMEKQMNQYSDNRINNHTLFDTLLVLKH